MLNNSNGKVKIKRLQLDTKKKTLLNELSQVRKDILIAARQFDPRQQEMVFIGSWSLLDLLAHLVGWDHTNKLAAQEIIRGKAPSFYGHYDKGWVSYNATLVSRHKKETIREMIRCAESSHEELIRYLNGLSPDVIFEDHGIRRGRYKVIISRLLEAEKEDEIRHLEQIRNHIS